MLSRRKPLAALVTVTAALAAGIPAATASAAPVPTVDPTVCQIINLPAALGPFGPQNVLGGASLLSVLANAGGTVGCAAAPASPSQPSVLQPLLLPGVP